VKVQEEELLAHFRLPLEDVLTMGMGVNPVVLLHLGDVAAWVEPEGVYPVHPTECLPESPIAVVNLLAVDHVV